MRHLLLTSVALAALAGSAFAADLPSTKSAPVFTAPTPVFSWTGFYAGVDIGGGWAELNSGNSFGSVNRNASGVVGGGHIGYNYQINQFVLGVEGDFLGTGISRSVYNSAFDFTTKSSQDYLGSINGRLGIAFDRTLLYAIGGYAFTQGSTTFTSGASGFLTPAGASASFSHDWSGYDIGGGVEYAFTPNWTGRVEYRYYDFGRWNYGQQGFLSSGRSTLTDSTVTVGLSYLFSAPAYTPVVAKY